MKCSLCGYEFDKDALICHAQCPLAQGCHIICCPNCGYQVVDETKSDTIQLLRKIKGTVRRWQSATEENT
jgi:hypothetical protein